MKKKFWKKHWSKALLSVLFIVGIAISSLINSLGDTSKPISYRHFQQMVKDKEVKSVVIKKSSEELMVTDNKNHEYITESPNYQNFKKELLEDGIKVTVDSSGGGSLFNTLTTLLIYGGIFYFLMKSNPSNTMGSKKMQTPVVVPTTTFKDVAGYAEQKQDLQTYVEYLKEPKVFRKKGAHMPKGVLLYGPPGTGKTMLARAVAGEAKVPFFSVSGSDFVEMFVGVGAKRVRSLFQTAREKAPCIVFIDEIDAIGSQRRSSNTEQTQTINALLSEMDGFDKGSGVLVLATTNRPDNLDNALTRSGRFDSHIAVPLPLTSDDRLQIINVHKKERSFAEDVDFTALSKQWIGFSGADIESLLNEAAIISVNKRLSAIDKSCIDEAFYKKVLKGHVKKKGQSERKKEELELVAHHEAGHAVARKLLNNGEVSKVTILSTTSGAGGVTFNVPEKMGLFSIEELESEIKVLYAGRAAEYLLYGKNPKKVTTGAQNDIQQATRVLKDMVIRCGMQPQPLLINLNDAPNGEDYAFEEMKKLSERLFNESVVLLESNQELLNTVSSVLLEKETIEADELNRLVEDYLESKKLAIA